MCRQFDSGPRHRTLLLGFVIILSCDPVVEEQRFPGKARNGVSEPFAHGPERTLGWVIRERGLATDLGRDALRAPRSLGDATHTCTGRRVSHVTSGLAAKLPRAREPERRARCICR